jgi:hypothetical protein
MKRFVIVFLLVLGLQRVQAQSQETLDKIESARIALITERLGLTPEEAEKFWPLYNEYSNQRETLRKEFMNARKQYQRDNLSEEEGKKLIEMGMQLKERQLALEKEYASRLTDVINNRQLVALKKAEEDFRKMLLERLQQRREKRERINNRQQRKNNNY